MNRSVHTRLTHRRGYARLKRAAERTGMLDAVRWHYYRFFTALRLSAKSAFYAPFIKSGDLVFDIGANLGQLTTVFVHLGARVVAVEPAERCVRRLRGFFEGNERVTILARAVSDREGAVVFHECPDSPEVSTIADKWLAAGPFSGTHQWSRRVEVQATTLDKLMQCYGVPSFVKVDVEGAERLVFAGMSVPPRALCFEFTYRFLDDARACIERLDCLGKAEFNVTPYERLELKCPTWLDAQGMRDYLDGAKGEETIGGDIFVRYRQ